MNRLRKCTFLLFVIVGLTGLLGCNKVATKTMAAALPETMSDHTYQAVYTSLDADLIFADGETLLAEKNGQKAIYENGELTENSEDDVIAMIRAISITCVSRITLHFWKPHPECRSL